MGKKYLQSPIVEAVCEFRFPPDTPWDLTIPGSLYDKLKDDFPLKEQRTIHEIKFDQTTDAVKQRIQSDNRMVFLSTDKKMFVQVGSRVLAVNRLKPYISWGEVFPVIQNSFLALTQITSITMIQRIGLRYINIIDLPKPISDLEVFFQFTPSLGGTLPRQCNEFFLSCEFLFNGQRDNCRTILSTVTPSSADRDTFALDLDYHLREPAAIGHREVITWVNEAHNHIEEVFEGCITDRLRNRFQEKYD
jgi:uncharacterized protein (TIGR04255 family)